MRRLSQAEPVKILVCCLKTQMSDHVMVTDSLRHYQVLKSSLHGRIIKGNVNYMKLFSFFIIILLCIFQIEISLCLLGHNNTNANEGITKDTAPLLRH